MQAGCPTGSTRAHCVTPARFTTHLAATACRGRSAVSRPATAASGTPESGAARRVLDGDGGRAGSCVTRAAVAGMAIVACVVVGLLPAAPANASSASYHPRHHGARARASIVGGYYPNSGEWPWMAYLS